MEKLNCNTWKTNIEKKEHYKVIELLLKYINRKSDAFILKGGTSLMCCYGLDRFSEDIDLDSVKGNAGNIINEFCENNGYTYRVAKDTGTTKRYMIHYKEDGKPLKVEISYRNKEINSDMVTNINGIEVYKINKILSMKTNAYVGRDKIRDLYDVTFIYNKYEEEINEAVKEQLKDAISYKGLEQVDYLISNQIDELINNEKLSNDFLDMYDKLGLLEYKIEENREIAYAEKNVKPPKTYMEQICQKASEKAEKNWKGKSEEIDL